MRSDVEQVQPSAFFSHETKFGLQFVIIRDPPGIFLSQIAELTAESL